MYDGELEGQMTFLTDANKRLIKVSDIYPEDVQLAKGDYIIRAQLRHDDTGLALLSLLSLHFPLEPHMCSQMLLVAPHADHQRFNVWHLVKRIFPHVLS